MYVTFNSILGIGLGLLYIYGVLPCRAGGKPRLDFSLYPVLHKGMIIIPISEGQALHVHHWMFYSIFLLFTHEYLNDLVRAYVLTLIFHGLFCYSDSLQFMEDNPWE